MKNVSASTTTIKGEFIPTFGVYIDNIGVVNTALIRVKVSDLRFFPTKSNPRSFHEGSTTSKIEATIQKEPQLFEVLNRGITVVCSGCNYSKGEITFTFTDDSQGLVDGGHSFTVASRNREQNANIIIRAFYGSGAEVLATRISETFNTSEKVRDMSMNNLKGYYDFIKKQIINQPWYFDIKWEENSKKRISCNRIVGLLNSFDPDRWGHGEMTNKMPTDSYNSARHTNDNFAELYQKYGESTDNPYYALSKVIVQIIDLFDYIEQNFVRLYNKIGRYKSINVTLPDKTKTKLIDIDKNKKFTTTFTNVKLQGYIPTPLIYAIIAPMRIFLERDKEGFWYFIVDPKTVFEQIGPKLIKFALDYYSIWDPKSAMKDPKFWTMLYDKTILLKNELK